MIETLKQQYKELRAQAGETNSSEDWEQAHNAAVAVATALGLSTKRRKKVEGMPEVQQYLIAAKYCEERV